MKKLIARLEALQQQIASGAMQAALIGAEAAAREARELAPVDSGELRDSISVSAEEGGALVRAGASHAAMVEYGTSKMPPRPFMQNAARAAQDIYFGAARRLIQGRDKT